MISIWTYIILRLIIFIITWPRRLAIIWVLFFGGGFVSQIFNGLSKFMINSSLHTRYLRYCCPRNYLNGCNINPKSGPFINWVYDQTTWTPSWIPRHYGAPRGQEQNKDGRFFRVLLFVFFFHVHFLNSSLVSLSPTKMAALSLKKPIIS